MSAVNVRFVSRVLFGNKKELFFHLHKLLNLLNSLRMEFVLHETGILVCDFSRNTDLLQKLNKHIMSESHLNCNAFSCIS